MKIPYLPLRKLPCSVEWVHIHRDKLDVACQQSSKWNISVSDSAFYTNLIRTIHQRIGHNCPWQQLRQSNKNTNWPYLLQSHSKQSQCRDLNVWMPLIGKLNVHWVLISNIKYVYCYHFSLENGSRHKNNATN